MRSLAKIGRVLPYQSVQLIWQPLSVSGWACEVSSGRGAVRS